MRAVVLHFYEWSDILAHVHLFVNLFFRPLLLFKRINCRESGAKCVFWQLIGGYAMNHKENQERAKRKSGRKLKAKNV